MDMTDEEMWEPFELIRRQSVALSDAIRKPDFNGFIRLDPTLNHANDYIHAADEVIANFPQGQLPLNRIVRGSVRESLRLVYRCAKRYGKHRVKKMSQAFHAHFRLWLYNGKPKRPPELFTKSLFKSEDRLLDAICNHNAAIDDPMTSNEAMRADETDIFMPKLHDVADCRRFCHALYVEVRQHLAERVHSETQAVSYILDGAVKGGLFYKDCLLARRIMRDRGWSRCTFTTYCKRSELPKPRNLRRAAKKCRHRKMVARELREIS